MLKRCWNCADFSRCLDFRTFAVGCLCCSVHRFGSPIKWTSNFVQVKNLNKKHLERLRSAPISGAIGSAREDVDR